MTMSVVETAQMCVDGTSDTRSEVETAQGDMRAKYEDDQLKTLGYNTGRIGRYVGGPSKQTLVMMRCAERMDRIFPEWLRTNVNDLGVYQTNDLNQINNLPNRINGPADYTNDSPITEIGRITAQMLCRGLIMADATPDRIYCSPAARCILTACAIERQALHQGKKMPKICIEPGLFELGQWYKNGMPQFMTEQEMIEAEMPVDFDYQPILGRHEMDQLRHETLNKFYDRIKKIVSSLAWTWSKPGITLIVTHSLCLDAAARGLLYQGKEPLAHQDIQHMGVHYPYCSMVVVNRNTDEEKWAEVRELLPPINYLDYSSRINHRFLSR